jgi:hypothetical protein
VTELKELGMLNVLQLGGAGWNLAVLAPEADFSDRVLLLKE